MQSGHIVTSYDQELARLRDTIARMGGEAGRQIGDAVRALVTRDAALAAEVMGRDAALDEAERQVETQTVRLLALRQPMARDLREIVSALKIAASLERIGDFAANVAKRSLALGQLPEVTLARSMRKIGDEVEMLLADVVKAYREDDADGAMAARERDAQVDATHTALFGDLLAHMMATPQEVPACTHLMFAAKNLERIGDHATNIAETLCFTIRGRLPEEQRHKGDQSSFMVPGVLPDGQSAA